MIYIDSEKKTNFKEEFKILAQKFPLSFNEKGAIPNGQPIRIEFAKRMPKVAVFKVGDKDTPVGTREVKPASQRISANGVIQEGGISKTWYLTKQAPTIKAGEKVFKKGYIEVNIPKSLDPTVDLETIVCLYFYSSAFSNNEYNRKRGKGQNAQFRFSIPAEKSKSKIEQLNFLSKYSKALIDEETRIGDDQLKELMEIMLYNPSGILEDDRLTMYETVTNDEKFRERFDKVYRMVKEQSSKVKEVMDVTKLIKAARSKGVLVEEENFWVVKNTHGISERQVVEVRGTKQAEKDSNLAEFLKISQEDIDLIQGYLD